MSGLYLAALVLTLACMVAMDWRWKLFFFAAPVRAAAIVVVGLIFFLAWDLVGISQGVFFRGAGPLLIGLEVAPELPIEEIFFLVVLCYFTMNVWQLVARRVRGRTEP